ncbi:hypothetical protein [Nocardioides sp.]|uniref:hypothetical protein n=1 Tax=Nocardioides sp. TaxID=35761 RepID=UPI0035161CA8
MTGDLSGTSGTSETSETSPVGPEPTLAVDLTKDTEEPTEQGGPAARGADSGWHPLNVTHLVLGAAFVGLAVVWAVLARDDVSLDDARWLLPLPWLVGGGLGLLATVAGGSRRQRH